MKQKQGNEMNVERILPAYPLWLIDPMFSVWSITETLHGSDTTFWMGAPHNVYGFVRYNGKTYCFMGRRDDAIYLPQTKVEIGAFDTKYTFENEEFVLKVAFISPLLLNDITIMSCPVCYTNYELSPKGEVPKDFSLAVALNENFCYNNEKTWIVGGVLPCKGYEAAYFSRGQNLILSNVNDLSAPDWGDIYLAAEEAWFVTENALNGYVANGKMQYSRLDLEKSYIVGVNKSLKGYFMTAYDDKVSIFYFGEWLKGYFFKDGKTIIDALDWSKENYQEIIKKCEDFDAKLKEDCDKIGKDYYVLACAALRQTVASHKLVENKKGELLFLSKENGSCGCINTVDVSYPSMPLFLLYNPKLVVGMLHGIFEFARKDVWTYDFAPHDIGTYPWCSGQTYAYSTKNDKYTCGMELQWTKSRTDFMTYLRPAESNSYDYSRQMPVEECGNMLIITAATIVAGSDSAIAKKNFDLLAQWVKYLEKYGLQPENQLCSDDFAGHLANNVNLAVKALVGIESFSIICKRLGKNKLAEKYEQKAKVFAEKLKELVGNGIMPLAYEQTDTYSLKYNILFDKLFGFNLIGQDICEKETSYYIEKNNRYGVPLDTRATYSKSDWILWAAALTDDKDKAYKLYAPLLCYLKESPTRVAFGDYYDTVNGRYINFINRSVQGGIFSLLLKQSGKMIVKN